jgi:hypothetical protein
MTTISMPSAAAPQDQSQPEPDCKACTKSAVRKGTRSGRCMREPIMCKRTRDGHAEEARPVLLRP